jgi:non-ribosomal peptide synthetase component F
LSARFDPRRYRLDVRQAPMMRVYIAHDARKDRWVMLHLFHHLLVDHTTLRVLLQEVQAHLLGRAEQLPAPPPFRNFIAQARLGVSRQEHEAFFRAMLGDVDEPTAPYGLIDAQGDGSGISEIRREVEAGLSLRLRQRARALGVSAASLCHLAWAQVLGRVSGRDDVVFGTVMFGRMHGGEGADWAPGMFINTLPLRIRVGAQSVEESVRQTHQSLTELIRHEYASLALAQRCSAVEAPTPLFSAIFNYRHSAAAETVAGAAEDRLLAWEGVEMLSTEDRSNYPISLGLDDLGEGFSLKAQAQSPVEPDRIYAYMHMALEQLVEALERTPSIPLRDLNVLPASERRQLLVEWNSTERSYRNDRYLHELIAEQAKRNGEAIAVKSEEGELSYGELNRRANQVGRYLQRLGVGPEVVVGLCLERSVEMVVGLLGVLKAGGVYLPLDAEYPLERLGYMLEDAGVGVVLTQRAL